MLHQAIQTEMVEMYASNINWKTSSTDLGIGAHKTLASHNGTSCVGDSAVLPDAQQRYNAIVKLSEVSSLQDGTGHFFAFITSNAKVHTLVYNSGRGYIGVYFRDTQQYSAYKIGEQAAGGAVKLDMLNTYIDSVYYNSYYDLDSIDSSDPSELMWSCSGIRGMLNIEKNVFNW